jgi:hypothetical protein
LKIYENFVLEEKDQLENVDKEMSGFLKMLRRGTYIQLGLFGLATLRYVFKKVKSKNRRTQSKVKFKDYLVYYSKKELKLIQEGKAKCLSRSGNIQSIAAVRRKLASRSQRVHSSLQENAMIRFDFVNKERMERVRQKVELERKRVKGQMERWSLGEMEFTWDEENEGELEKELKKMRGGSKFEKKDFDDLRENEKSLEIFGCDEFRTSKKRKMKKIKKRSAEETKKRKLVLFDEK